MKMQGSSSDDAVRHVRYLLARNLVHSFCYRSIRRRYDNGSARNSQSISQFLKSNGRQTSQLSKVDNFHEENRRREDLFCISLGILDASASFRR